MSQKQSPRPVPKVEYHPPRLARLGSAVELTKNRAMVGRMDGGSNNSRTG